MYGYCRAGFKETYEKLNPPRHGNFIEGPDFCAAKIACLSCPAIL
jgi:hypothetical protein